MNEISTKQGSNRFITGVSYVFPDNIDSEQHFNDKVWITLKAGIEWNTIYFTPGTAKLNCSSTNQFEGKIIINQFEMSLPGGGGDFGKDVRRICNRSIVLAITFSDGEILVAGGQKKKLRLEYKAVNESVSSYVLSFDYSVSEPFRILD